MIKKNGSSISTVVMTDDEKDRQAVVKDKKAVRHMPLKAAVLPSVKTTPEFKKRIEDACASVQLPYSDVILQLLQEWIAWEIDVTQEPDPDFVASAQEALRSEHVQKALKKLGENYIFHRAYPHAIKAS